MVFKPNPAHTSSLIWILTTVVKFYDPDHGLMFLSFGMSTKHLASFPINHIPSHPTWDIPGSDPGDDL